MKVKETEVSYLREQIETRSEYLNEIYQEELSAGGGAIAGIGVENPSISGNSRTTIMENLGSKKRKEKNLQVQRFLRLIQKFS